MCLLTPSGRRATEVSRVSSTEREGATRGRIAAVVLVALLASASLAVGAQTITTIAAGALNTPQGIARAANGNLDVAMPGRARRTARLHPAPSDTVSNPR